VRVARRRTVSPDQPLRVLDTSPFRIAIVYSIVFACGAAALLGAVDFAVSQVVDGSTDNLIEAEVQGLREQVLVLSRSDFIEVIEQRSQAPCIQGRTWGYQSDGIWVAQGCSAVFALQGGGGPPPRPGNRIDCESQNYQQNFCGTGTRIGRAWVAEQRSQSPSSQVVS